MDVLVWISEATWQACMDAVELLAPDGASVTLLHVVDESLQRNVRGAGAGLLGGSRRSPRGALQEEVNLAERLGQELLNRASQRSAHPVSLRQRRGRVETEVVAEAAGKDLLVMARDGDMRQLGPRSIGPATRFVLDHAPCAALLVWPDRAPDLSSIPPPPHDAPRRD